MAARAISSLTTKVQSARVRLIRYCPSALQYNWLVAIQKRNIHSRVRQLFPT